MSTHDGVSCDSCLKSNFRGRRYKCLICYDYDLCAACYEASATNTRHTIDHPMQCILTRADFEMYYGGEGFSSSDQPQSYTCPFCYRMGFTETTLHEHVTTEHGEASCEVICPICAAMPGGDPNLMTDDFAGHLTLEHRTGPRDLISFLDEPVASRHTVRRIPHSTHLPRGGGAAQSTRARRSNMHFSVFSSGGLSSLSPSSRESVDPIAELLSQLSGVRRSTSNTNTNTPTQLQQLQMQLQMERQQVNQARQQLERLPRRQPQSQTTLRETTSSNSTNSSTILVNPTPANATISVNTTTTQTTPSTQNNFLLSRIDAERPNFNVTDIEDCSHAFVTSLVRYTMTLEKTNSKKLESEIKDVEKSAKIKDNDSACGVESKTNLSPPSARDGRILRGRARSNSANVSRQDISKSSKDARENPDRSDR